MTGVEGRGAGDGGEGVVDLEGSGGVGVVPRCMGSGRLVVKEEEDGVGGDLGMMGSMGWLATEVEEESLKKRRVSLSRLSKRKEEERREERTDITIRASIV